MKTIRGRLVVAYAMALAATLFVFATTLYFVQRSFNFDELDRRARDEANRVATILHDARLDADTIVLEDEFTGRLKLVETVASLIDAIPDYLVIADSAGNDLYLSDASRRLAFPAVQQLLAAVMSIPGDSGFGVVDLGEPVGDIRFYVRRVTDAGPAVRRILSGVATSGFLIGPTRLLSTMLMLFPLIIGASILVGYYLAGRALRPVDNIVDEVKAISDGRSLHRRLAEPMSDDELARLTTTLNEMFARLETSFATLRRFTADASHELKTPLTVLRAGIERAITHPDTSADLLETLEETLLVANRMAELIDALLVLARADEGRARLHVEKVDLSELLSELAETAGILGEQALVSVEVALPERPITLAVDRSRIRQLLMNLLTNAIKYTPKGGRVTVSCNSLNGRVVLSVKDTGIGIAPGDLPHIFDRFWRADPARSRTSQRPGAGLGLAISKWIAEVHGGEIHVVSKPGRGTTFTVTLPSVTDSE